MGHHVVALDGIGFEQLRDGRCGGTFFVNETPHTFARIHALTFKKCNAPPISMVVSATAALRKPSKAHVHTGGQVTVHSEELAHGLDSKSKNQASKSVTMQL